MTMFIGQYRHNLDAKNRIIVPARFRDGLGEEFVVTKGLDGCLSIFTADKWTEMIGRLERIPNVLWTIRAVSSSRSF